MKTIFEKSETQVENKSNFTIVEKTLCCIYEILIEIKKQELNLLGFEQGRGLNMVF